MGPQNLQAKKVYWQLLKAKGQHVNLRIGKNIVLRAFDSYIYL